MLLCPQTSTLSTIIFGQHSLYMGCAQKCSSKPEYALYLTSLTVIPMKSIWFRCFVMVCRTSTLSYVKFSNAIPRGANSVYTDNKEKYK